MPQIYSQNENHDNKLEISANLVGVVTPQRSGMMERVGVWGLPIFNEDRDNVVF